MNFTINEFLTSLRYLVMFSAGETVCKTLNGFAIIDDTFDFDVDLIEAKADKHLYFSRDGQRMLYPALAVSFTNKSLGRYRDVYTDFCHNIVIGVIDQYASDCINCGDKCKERSKTQIYIDTAYLLRKTLNTLVNFSMYRTEKDSVIGYLYANQAIIDLLIDNGVYDSAVLEKSDTSKIQSSLQTKNENISFFETPVSKQSLLSTFANMNVCDICNSDELVFAFKKYKGQNCC